MIASVGFSRLAHAYLQAYEESVAVYDSTVRGCAVVKLCDYHTVHGRMNKIPCLGHGFLCPCTTCRTSGEPSRESLVELLSPWVCSTRVFAISTAFSARSERLSLPYMEAEPSSRFVCFPATYMYPRVPTTPATANMAYSPGVYAFRKVRNPPRGLTYEVTAGATMMDAGAGAKRRHI